MKATHDTFTIERILDATPDRVFAALGDPEKKAKWFVGPSGWKLVERTFDFRVGGRERVVGTFPDGKTSALARSSCSRNKASSSATPLTRRVASKARTTS